jgi:16S rRNA (cytosine967-C5)-methyltransferase
VSAPTAARSAAFKVVLETFDEGAFTDLLFRRVADETGLDARDRAQAQRLAYGAVQRRGSADRLIGRLAQRSPALLDPPVAAALRLGLYELLYTDATPDHAAVGQGVELVKEAGFGHASGLVNAVLRRAARERDALLAELGDDATPETASAAHSIPRWLAELWWAELGPDVARSVMRSSNEPPERALRVNTLRATRDELLERLHDEGVRAGAPSAAAPLAPAEMIVVEGRLGAAVDLIKSGELVPQSRGSAAVVELLEPGPGEHVLDLCAGPGIKTGQMGVRMEGRGEVLAVERDRARAAEIAGGAERLGLRNITVVEADATELDLGPREFDRVLLDAPCSDLGALASRPDARWRKSPDQIRRLADLQEALLRRGLAALRPRGTLVYATCTISRAENEAQLARLFDVAERGDVPSFAVDDLGAAYPAVASPVDSRALQIRPDRDRTTGFFVFRLRRDE